MIVNLVQGSPAWMEWRAHGIGGSDAGRILAAHEKRRGSQEALRALLGEKLAPAPPAQDYPDHWRPQGPAPAVRRLTQEVGVRLVPACVQHDTVPWLRATLGGVCWAGDAVALSTQSNIPEHELFLAGELPGEHQAQAQHALYAADAELLWYVSTCARKRFALGERWAVVEVRSDAEYLPRLLDAEVAFWKRLCEARNQKENHRAIKTAS